MRAMTGSVLVAMLSFATVGAQEPNSIAEIAAGSEQIVMATITEVEAMEASNEFGDRLIVSQATLTVEEVLKGDAVTSVTLYLEGGTLGDITMHVSDLPLVQPGDRGVFFVGRSASGLEVPHRRGRGILMLDEDDFVKDSTLSLSDIRAQISAQP